MLQYPFITLLHHHWWRLYHTSSQNKFTVLYSSVERGWRWLCRQWANITAWNGIQYHQCVEATEDRRGWWFMTSNHRKRDGTWHPMMIIPLFFSYSVWTTPEANTLDCTVVRLEYGLNRDAFCIIYGINLLSSWLVFRNPVTMKREN